MILDREYEKRIGSRDRKQRNAEYIDNKLGGGGTES